MAHAGRFQRQSLRGVRRKTAWSTGPSSNDDPQAITGSGPGLVTIGVQPLIEGLTIARIRGYLYVTQAAGTSAGDGFVGAFGLCVVTDAAFTAGVAAVPTPITEAGWDGWMYHTMLAVQFRGTAVGDGPASYISREVDVKAMRKNNVDEILIGVFEFTETGTATMELYFDSRVLDLLP